MAKKSFMLFKLLSTGGSGFFYVGKKSTRYIDKLYTCL